MVHESVMDVLFYLFDYVLDDEPVLADLTRVCHQLSAAGFSAREVDRAVDWFSALSDLSDFQPSGYCSSSIRVFSEQEWAVLGGDGVDYLQGLLRHGQIQHDVLEKVIERALALDESLDLSALCWVMSLVIFNIYGASAEDVVSDVLCDWENKYRIQ